jgi:tetratricopeptide (TPR) repeat protein
MAKREPVLLLLDDLQWADGATLALLEYLARLAPQTGVLLVGAYRDVEIRREHPLGSAIAELERGPGVETLALGGLAPEPVRELLEALAGHAVPEAFLETLHRATHGNPFFVRELLRQLAREGTLERDLRGRWTASRAIEGLGLPASIRALVKERIARVSEEGQRLLAAASAWEGAFPFEITYRAAGLEEEAALDALDEVLEAQLVQPSGESDVYEFGHALVRHTVYEGLASPGRVRLHRRLADEAEQFHGARAHEHAAEIAVQYHRSAGLPGAERGADHAIAAAEAAERAAALEELARFLRMALDLLPEGDERRPRILARLGVALAWSGASEEAGRVASEAGELLAATEGPGAAAEYLADVAAGLWAVGAAAVAWTLAAAGLRHAGSRRDATWAVLVSHDLDRREAEDPANPGISLDAAERRQAWELIAKTWRADDSGAPGEKAPRFARFAIVPGKWMVVASRREALERWPDVVVPLAFWAGEYRRALELNERRLTTDLAGGRLADVAWAMSLRIRLHTALGDLEAAQEALERASELAERVRSTPVVTWLLGAARLELALVRDARGEWLASGAEAMLAQDAPENRWFAAVLRVAAALGQALLGNADAALARLAETLPAIERASAGAPEYTGLICHAASVLWLLGRADHAMVLERNLRAKVLAADFRYPQVDARLALAHVCALTGRHDEARAWFARARGVLDEQGARPLRAIVDYDEALAFQRRGRRGDRTRTRPLLDAARAQFEAIGMPGWIARAEALARSLG